MDSKLCWRLGFVAAVFEVRTRIIGCEIDRVYSAVKCVSECSSMILFPSWSALTAATRLIASLARLRISVSSYHATPSGLLRHCFLITLNLTAVVRFVHVTWVLFRLSHHIISAEIHLPLYSSNVAVTAFDYGLADAVVVLGNSGDRTTFSHRCADHWTSKACTPNPRSFRLQVPQDGECSR